MMMGIEVLVYATPGVRPGRLGSYCVTGFSSCRHHAVSQFLQVLDLTHGVSLVWIRMMGIGDLVCARFGPTRIESHRAVDSAPALC